MNADLFARAAVDPDHLERLDEEELIDVLASPARLNALVWSRLLRLSAKTIEEDGEIPKTEGDQLIDVNEVASILAVSPRWLYDYTDQLPFACKLAPRTLRFSERGVYRWLKTRRLDV